MGRALAAGAAALAALLLAAPLAAAPRSAADPLAAARGSIDALELDDAKARLSDALATGVLDPQDVVEAYLLLGVVHGAAGDPPAAETAFACALSIDPTATLPVTALGASVKWEASYRAAQRAIRQSGSLAAAVVGLAEERRVAIAVDPRRLVAGGTVRSGRAAGALGPPVAVLREGDALPLPPDAGPVVAVELTDRFGNRLLALTSAAPPPLAAPVAPPLFVVEPRELVPMHRRWSSWAALAGAGAALGTYYLARGSEPPVAERDRRRAIGAFAAAGASAAVAVVLAVRERGERPLVSVAPLERGGAVALDLSFE